MTVRTALVVELFARCRNERPGVEWIEGWPGDNPPREHVWMSDILGDLGYPTFRAPTPEQPLTVQDEARITLSSVSATAGQSRAVAMANAEDYLSTALRIVAGDPDLGGVIPLTIAIAPAAMRGPYSMPNAVEPGGFAAMAELEFVFTSRPD